MANTVNVTTANTFEQWRVKTNELGTKIGDLDEVTNSDIGATTIVAAVKAHQSIVAGSITLSGGVEMTGDLDWADNAKIKMGTGNDLQIYHDGSNSYIANSTGALKIATETSGIAITIGHSTSEVTVADNMTVAGDLTVTGTASFGDTNITNVGSITLDTIANDGSDGVTIDSSTDVIIDAGGADIILKDDGTEFGRFTNNSTDFEIKVSTQDKDIKFIGDDGGSAITALSLDMSAAGDATFNNQVIVGDGKLVLNSTAVTSTAAELNALDGITSTVAELNIVDGDTSASAVTIVDADQIILNDAGTMKQVAVSALNTYTSSSIAADNVSSGSSAVNLTTSSGNITIDAAANDSDIIFKGTDNSSDITMLTLDGSAAGAASFNSDVTVGALLKMPDNTSAKILVADGTSFQEVAVSGDVGIASNGAVTIAATSVENSMLAGSIADSKLSTITTANKVGLAALDIDGGTDIGEALVDADLFVVDNGAGGTNRKVAASRLVTYIDANSSAASTGKAIAMAIVFG